MRRTRPTIITVASASDERNIGSGKQTTDKRRVFSRRSLVRRRLSCRDVRGRRTADELCSERGHARRCCAWAWVGAVETIRFHLLVCRTALDGFQNFGRCHVNIVLFSYVNISINLPGVVHCFGKSLLASRRTDDLLRVVLWPTSPKF